MKTRWPHISGILFSCVMMILLSACGKQSGAKKANNDNELNQKLVGTWRHSESNLIGRIVVTSSGNYYSQVQFADSSGVQTQNIEGTWQIEDGDLVDTMLKHSNTNAHLPHTMRAKIIQIDAHQFVLKEVEGLQPTNEVIFIKVK